jgi:hypothetical protein
VQADWRPFFWEPVEGTGERLMAGVVLHFNGQWGAHRMLRDDVLDSLYGKAAANPRRLIDEALKLCMSIAEAGGVDALAALQEPLMGLHPGTLRSTDALTLGEALRHAVLMHASLAQLDGWDDLDESDAPAAEEVNKRFATEVREAVVAARPHLARNFGKTAQLIHGGRPVRFGYLSDIAVMHFSVLHPVRQAASVRDARARLWELSRAQQTAAIGRAALLTWIPSEEDPTLGEKQREGLRSNRVEMEREADAVGMRLLSVATVEEARARVLETVE